MNEGYIYINGSGRYVKITESIGHSPTTKPEISFTDNLNEASVVPETLFKYREFKKLKPQLNKLAKVKATSHTMVTILGDGDDENE